MKKLSGKYITVPLARRIIGMPGHASSKFNRCIGTKLFGQRYTGSNARLEVRSAFSAAAKSCK